MLTKQSHKRAFGLLTASIVAVLLLFWCFQPAKSFGQGLLTAVPVGTNPRSAAVHPDGSRIYVGNTNDNTVSVIDASSLRVVDTIEVGRLPRGLALLPDGSRLYVANQTSNTVSVIDTSTNSLLLTIDVGRGPTTIAITSDGRRLYVDNFFGDNISVIDTMTNLVLATIPVGDEPVGTAVLPDGSKAYTPNSRDNTVSVIDTFSNTVIETIPVGDRPQSAVATRDGGRLYIAHLDGDNIVIIDTATELPVGLIPMEGAPRAMAVSPDGSQIYVANTDADNIRVIETRTNDIVATVSVGDEPYWVAFAPDGERAYVPNSRDGTVSVINTAPPPRPQARIPTPAPQAVVLTAPPEANGLLAEFFDFPELIRQLPDLEGRVPIQSFVVPQVDFNSSAGQNFGTTSPPLTETFAIRFSGFIEIGIPGFYTFSVQSDDGFRLQIGGVTVAEFLETRGFSTTSGDIVLSRGTFPINIDYFENTGGQGIILSYTPPGGTSEVVPTEILLAPAPSEPAPPPEGAPPTGEEPEVVPAPPPTPAVGEVIVESIEPGFAFPEDEVTLTFFGFGFQETPDIFFRGGGIRVSSVEFVNSRELAVTISITPTAAISVREVFLINPDGSEAIGQFEVRSPEVERVELDSVSPVSAPRGTSNLDLIIFGAGFTEGIDVAIRLGGIIVNSVRFVESSRIIANVDITDDAFVGSREVIVTNPDGSRASGFLFSVTEAFEEVPTAAATLEVTGVTRSRPQVLAAGFDPIIVDRADTEFDFLAIVRPGAVRIRSVTFSQNEGPFSFTLSPSQTLQRGEVLYRATFSFARGSFGETVLRTLFGPEPGQFNFTVIDQAEQRHSFPDVEFTNAPQITTTIRPEVLIDDRPGVKRVRPQVLTAGLDPIIIDTFSDTGFDFFALVRPGAVRIASVTFSQNLGPFSVSLQEDETLPNGDVIYRATFNFARGSFGEFVLRAAFGPEPDQFNFTIIDAAQQRHRFPDVEFGDFPAL